MSYIKFLARCKMREFDIDFETAKEWIEDDFNEFDMLSKMTSKEKLEYLKKRNAPSKEELEIAERRKGCTRKGPHALSTSRLLHFPINNRCD